ncbi:SMI1/KNR4 family protein [Paenibacillus donghaensis]|uniref:Uncharacterized protein n=1 Tax=Paenibacillus donghaensis TaxID=414771 RepID=A0A2Z2K5B0_9BACL|nr:SMI1/KNR4 family protein [Paenibacillus donghaensis]ASA21256.1 hypothetical protein B9T62_10945 [Paenibacillus donghaensis]
MWSSTFEQEFSRLPGATSDEIASFVKTWNGQLTEQEMQEIRDSQRNPFPQTSPFYSQYKPLEPSTWLFPQRDFPQSYLNFLSFANGGEFQNGERYFQFFGTVDLREMNRGFIQRVVFRAGRTIAQLGCIHNPAIQEVVS